MCRGLLTYRSRYTAPLPNAASASCCAWPSSGRNSSSVMASRMPRPPPPAVALIMMGKPTWAATTTASSASLIRPSEPGTVGTPAFCGGGGAAGGRVCVRVRACVCAGGGGSGSAAAPLLPRCCPCLLPSLSLSCSAIADFRNPCSTPLPHKAPTPHHHHHHHHHHTPTPTHTNLHRVARRRLVSHDADGVGLGADELQAVVGADVHKGGVLRQEAVALRGARSTEGDRRWRKGEQEGGGGGWVDGRVDGRASPMAWGRRKAAARGAAAPGSGEGRRGGREQTRAGGWSGRGGSTAPPPGWQQRVSPGGWRLRRG